MKYHFEITETLSRTVEIEAESVQEAHRKGCDLYKDCEIILDADDFIGVEFKILEDEKATTSHFGSFEAIHSTY